MAAARLYRLKDEYGPRMHLVTKAYPLLPGEAPGRPITPHSRRGRLAAGEEGANEGLIFRPWPETVPVPASSMPALEAAKCASLQGDAPFRAYDQALFRAFFQECRDISDGDVLAAVADEVGLDLDRFTRDRDQGRQRPLVMAEYLECLERFGSYAQGIPLVSLNDGPPLVGCPPMEVYRRAVARQVDPLSA